MGRYDKIKVFDGSVWQTPTRLKVYQNGEPQDLGRYDDPTTKKLSVWDGTEFVRVTLNRRDIPIVTDRYTTGSFSLKPTNGYCYCTNSSSTTNYKWELKCTVRKTQATDQNIFKCDNGWGDYIRVTWLENGKIKVTNKYVSADGTVVTTEDSLTTTHAFNINTWITLQISTAKSSSTMIIKVNGTQEAKGTVNNFFQFKDCKTTVGASKINFKNSFTASGSGYDGYGHGSPYTASFDASTAKGEGNYYKGVTHYEQTSTQTVYE